jgi:sugar lactone lactonase YvrE
LDRYAAEDENRRGPQNGAAHGAAAKRGMPPRVTAIRPPRAIEGGRITIEGSGFPTDSHPPIVRFGNEPARVVCASSAAISVVVPPGLEGGPTDLRIDGVSGETLVVDIAAPLATGLHQVDNPVLDRERNVYVTYSGTRGQQVPVSVFRIRPNGTRETFSSGIVNPTSMAFDPLGRLYVSSRFEGIVYRLDADGGYSTFASDLGVACGLAFSSDGTLFVGDRSGTVFKVDPTGRAEAFASLPPSVAAFHLAMGPDDTLCVTAPTLASYDVVYRILPDGTVIEDPATFGRPQGIAFDSSGVLFVVEALAGSSGLYRVPAHGQPELVLAGPGLVGVAFDPAGGLIVCSNETAYRAA